MATTDSTTTTTTPVNSGNTGLFGGTTLGNAPVGSPLLFPSDLSASLKIKPGSGLLYQPEAKAGVKQKAYAPTTGKELYESIFQSKYSPEQKQRLVDTFFPAGFDPTGKDASKVFSAVTMNLTEATRTGSSTANLDLYRTPSISQIAGSTVGNEIIAAQNAGNTAQAQLTLGRTSATVSQEESAYSIVAQYLDNWGLSSEAGKVYNMITHQGDQVINTDSILEVIRGNAPAPSYLGANATNEFKTAYNNAFPGLASYNQNAAKAGGVNVHMTETAYQDYSTKVIDSATQYGMKTPSKQQIGELLNNHVSAVEYQQRVQDIYTAVENADPGVKALLQSEFGINKSDITQYLITGELPRPKGEKGKMPAPAGIQTMQRQIATADIQDYSQRVGLNGLNRGEAGSLAQMAKLAATQGNQGLGYGITQIEQGLLGASRDVALTKALPGAGTPTVDTKTLIASQLAGFGGISQVAAQTQVARAEEAKVAPFEKGGGYAESAKGVIGLGAART